MIDAISGSGVSFGSNAFSQVQAYYAANPGILKQEKLDQAKDILQTSNTTISASAKHHLLGALNHTQIGPFDINKASANATAVLGHLVSLSETNPEFFEAVSGEADEDEPFFNPTEAKTARNNGSGNASDNVTIALVSKALQRYETGKLDGATLRDLLDALLKGQTPTIESKEMKDLLAVLMQVLANGIEDLMELSMVTVLVALLGRNLPNALLLDIKDKLEDFVKSNADTGGNYLETLSFINLVQSLTSGLPELTIPAVDSIKQEATIQQQQVVDQQFYDPEKSTDQDVIQNNPLGEFNPLAIPKAKHETVFGQSDGSDPDEALYNLGAQTPQLIAATLNELGYSPDKVQAASAGSGELDSEEDRRGQINDIHFLLLEEADNQHTNLNAGVVTTISGIVKHGLSDILDRIEEESALLES